MNELEHLKSIWPMKGDGNKTKVKRKTDLIVPCVIYDGKNGSLNNDSWAFKVTFHFREALDIKYEERKKDKKAFMVWTQGPFLSFKEGDMLHSKDGKQAVQVLSADRMSWDSKKAKMYEGAVVYTSLLKSDGSFTRLDKQTCTQMQFLKLLIRGEYDN